MTKKEERLEARRLRKEEGWSINQIAKHLGVSKGSVSVWCQDIKLTAEQRHNLHEKKITSEAQMRGSQTNKRKARLQREKFQQQGREKAREGDILHSWGCMLYWAEGHKSRNELRFSNSDPDMIALFMRFIREALEVPKDKIKARVVCYLHNGITQEEIEDYWQKITNIPTENWNTSKTSKPKSSKQKGRKLLYGLCEISVSSTEYVQHIYGALQEYGGFDRPKWRDMP